MTMQVIKIKKIKENKAASGKGYYSVLDDKDKWHACWLDNRILLHEGEEAMVRIEEKKVGEKIFSNITHIETGEQKEVDGIRNPLPPTPAPESVQKSFGLSDPPKSGDELIDEINTINDDLHKNIKALGEDRLTEYEVKLAALNIKISEKLGSAIGQHRIKEWTIKKDIKEAIVNLRATKTLDEAKDEAEKSLSKERAEALALKNRIDSYSLIVSGVKNMLLAIKDRVKLLRK